MKIIKCSICQTTEDMRKLPELFEEGDLWFEDDESDLCPSCYTEYMEMCKDIRTVYREEADKIYEELKAKHTTNVVNLH